MVKSYKKMRYAVLMVQEQPHLDALVSLYMAFNAAPQGWDFRYAVVKYWGYGTVHPSGKTWEDYAADDRAMLIGVGGSPLDEHPSPDFGDRKAQGESSASLTAKMLGLDKHPLYRTLVQLVTKFDLEGAGEDRQLNLAAVIQQMHRLYSDEPDRIIRWTFDALDAIVAKQQRFLDAVRQISDGTDSCVEHVEIDGKGYNILGIDSDNDQMGAAARSRGFAATIQYRSTGHVLIFGNQRLGVKMCKNAVAVRSAELMKRGRGQEAKDYLHMLGEPGQMTLVPNWCYQMPGDNMLNGTETTSKLEPTKIKPAELMAIVKENLVIEVPAMAT